MRYALGPIAMAALVAAASTTTAGRAGERSVPVHPLQADSARIEALPLCALANYYVSCERRARSGRLAPADVPACSLAYEVLKHKAFAGDWRRMHAWTPRALALDPCFITTRDDDPLGCGAPA